jgi:hypothetical protein
MWGRFPDRRALIFGAVVLLALVALWLALRNRKPHQEDGPEPGDKDELFLSADPPVGRWDDPAAGARSEEHRREIGVALSRREEAGPVRCVLRAVPGSAASKKPEVEVELINTGMFAVRVPILRSLLDRVTFIFRGPDDEVVSSFCYLTVYSDFHANPPLLLKPGEPLRDSLYLSVAADHGFQALRPGMYSLEAVFTSGLGEPRTLLARSNRLPVRVGKR